MGRLSLRLPRLSLTRRARCASSTSSSARRCEALAGEACGTHRMHISPLAMRIAMDLKVDLAAVKGTGPDGAITKADVERAATVPPTPAPAPPIGAAVEAPAPAAPAKPVVAPIDHHAAMRRVIAAAMARSKREIPHYYLGTHIDMSKAMAWLQAENLKRPVTERLLYSVLLLKAVALAVHEVPEMNGFWIDGAFKRSEAVHVGVAISIRQGGLIAPAIHERRQEEPRRDHGEFARSGKTRACRRAPQFGNCRCDDHGHQPR